MNPITEDFKAYGIQFTTDKEQIDKSCVLSFLQKESYWGMDRTAAAMDKVIENSLCIVVLKQGKQIGFARIVTDYTLFGYLADVFILKEEQGQGYGKALMQFILSIPFIQELRFFCLATRDAHGLYRQYGFAPSEALQNWMEIRKSNPALEAQIKARFNF